MPRITLLTDFGTADGYVAAMKGVIASIAPDAIIDDVTHDIAPGDVRAAAWTLVRYWRYYPPGTVHVLVVDPGVGSARRALIANIDGRILVAPDNGLLTLVLEDARAPKIVSIENRALLSTEVSSTFHGRDIFAPCAAHLANGALLDEFGPTIGDPVKLTLPRAEATPEGMRGVVAYIDRFGNLITNIRGDFARGAHVRVAGKSVGRVMRTYADVASGELVALIGSDDYLEIAVRDRNAAEVLGVTVGADVRADLA
jgi:S-adenosyl-L-methionine hydrolase (adenosine-forming)